MTRQVYVLTVEIEGSHSQIDNEHKVVMQALTKAKRFIELNGQGSHVETNIHFFNPSMSQQLYHETARTIASLWGVSKGPLKTGLIFAKDELVKAIKDAW